MKRFSKLNNHLYIESMKNVKEDEYVLLHTARHPDGPSNEKKHTSGGVTPSGRCPCFFKEHGHRPDVF